MGKPNITELKKLIKKREEVSVRANELFVLLMEKKTTKKAIETKLDQYSAEIRSIDCKIKWEALNE